MAEPWKRNLNYGRWKPKTKEQSKTVQPQRVQTVCVLLHEKCRHKQNEWLTSCGLTFSLVVSIGLHQQTLTIWWCSDDRACVISLSQISKSTFIIHCDKLTEKMSVKFYTYMNFCVTSPSVHLFICLAIAVGFILRGRFMDFVSRPSDTSPFALVNLLINFGCSP